MTKTEEIRVIISAYTKGYKKELDDALLKARGFTKNTQGGLEASTATWKKYRAAVVREMEAATRGVKKEQEKMRALRDRVSNAATQRADVIAEKGVREGWTDRGIADEIKKEGLSAAVADSDRASKAYAKAKEQLAAYTQQAREAKEALSGLNEKVRESQAAADAEKARAKAALENAKAQALQRKEREKATVGVRKFGLTAMGAMLGARTLYLGLRKLITGISSAMMANTGLNKSLREIKGNLSIAFQGIFQAVLPALQQLVSWLSTATNWLAQFIGKLTGISWGKAKKGAQDYAKAVSGAGKAAKGSLAAFDELNMITQQEDGGGGASGPDTSAIFDDQKSFDFSWLTDMTLRWKDIFFKWEALGVSDIIDKVVVGLGTISGTLIGWKVGGIGGAAIGAIIGTGIGLAVTELLPDFTKLTGIDVKKLFSAGLSGALGLAIGFGLGGLPGGIMGFLVGAGISLAFDKFIIDKMPTSKEWIGDILDAVRDAIAGAGLGVAIGGLIGTALGAALTPIGAVIFGVLGAALGAAVGLAIKHWEEIKQFFADLWASISNGVKEAWDGIGKFFSVTIPKLVTDIVNWFADLPEKLGYAIGFVIGKLGAWANNAGIWVGREVPKIIESIVAFFAELPGKIKEKLDMFKEKIIQWKDDAVSWFRDTAPQIINSVIDWFAKLPDALKNIGKNMIYGLWNGILSAGNWLWNRIKSFFGGAWQAVQDIFDGFGAGIEAGYASVPHLAAGGIVQSDTLARIGENGREAVLPLDRNTGWMERLAGMIGSGDNRDVLLELRTQNQLLRALLVKEGNVVFAPSTEAGRWASRSMDMYELARG